ncbi:IS66 family transposase [Bradyrhizobium sp. Arg314]
MKRIEALLDIEREIKGLSPAQRRAPGAERAGGHRDRSLDDRDARQGLARTRSDKYFNYMPRRWSSFTRLLDDGRICLSNNAAVCEPCAVSMRLGSLVENHFGVQLFAFVIRQQCRQRCWRALHG